MTFNFADLVLGINNLTVHKLQQSLITTN